MSSLTDEHINEKVQTYYSDKLKEHGATPKGVDWNSVESQATRYAQLLKVCKGKESLSINDIGCGYGYLFQYLQKHQKDFQYYGVDVSESMIETAKDMHKEFKNFHAVHGSVPKQLADYSVASGIFNVRLNFSNEEWLEYILNTLQIMNESCTEGFSFNCLTSHSDLHKQREDLYYTDPSRILEHCIKNFSRNVTLLHGYGLYEFTVLVHKGNTYE